MNRNMEQCWVRFVGIGIEPHFPLNVPRSPTIHTIAKLVFEEERDRLIKHHSIGSVRQVIVCTCDGTIIDDIRSTWNVIEHGGDSDHPLVINVATKEYKQRVLLEKKLEEHIYRLQQCTDKFSVPDMAEVYRIQEKFDDPDQYFFVHLGKSFYSTSVKGILYRPNIVNEIMELIDHAQQQVVPTGVQVAGPQGVGKSHSLVNLVRKLLYGSNMKCHVVFVPQCSDFKSIQDLYDAVCQSFGFRLQELGFKPTEDAQEAIEFIKSIQWMLDKKKNEMTTWVFIFDHVHDLLQSSKCSSAALLWSTIESVMKVGGVVSVISGYVNTKAEQEYFLLDYSHCHSMTQEEACFVFPSLQHKHPQLIDQTMSISGGVPLQISNFIDLGFDEQRYDWSVVESIYDDLWSLKKSDNWSDIKKSVIACVLGNPNGTHWYDRKNMVPVYDKYEFGYYRPLHPAVKRAYQRFLSREIQEYVQRNNFSEIFKGLLCLPHLPFTHA